MHPHAMHGTGNTTKRLLPNPNALVAISKDMWALKLCSDKILQFLTAGGG